MRFIHPKVIALAVGGLACILAAVFVARNHSALLNDLPPPARDLIRGAWHGFRIDRDVMIPMPDGVRLATNVYFPKGELQRTGTVLIRLPYGKNTYGEAYGSAEWFAQRGFVAVVQDVRGKGQSEGIYTPNYLDDQDGVATLDWIVKQPWSNGKVGTFGCSALGESQVVLARARHPAHAAMISQADGGALGVIPGRLDPFGWYEGGVFNLASGFGWFLVAGGKQPGQPDPQNVPVDAAIWELPTIDLLRRYRKDPTDYERFLGEPFDEMRWKDSGYIGASDRFATPAIMITTWQDQAVTGTLALADLIKRNAENEATRRNNHVIITAGNHCNYEDAAKNGMLADMPIGEAARQPYWDWHGQWFDYWLLGKGSPPELPAYLLYVTGEDRWVSADAWPPPEAKVQRWFLESGGRANTAAGDGRLVAEVPQTSVADAFAYDPANPVPTRGGPFCCTNNPELRQGPVDQAEVEARQDVLVYSSEPLSRGVRVVGPISAELFVASSALDTDLTAKLVDVAPGGKALNIQEGALRLRYREGYERASPLTPGDVYRVAVEMRATGHYFAAGHRIRLQVSSSNFPRLERNLNTGGRNFDETKSVIANNRIFHGPDAPSALVLSVLDDAAVAKH